MRTWDWPEGCREGPQAGLAELSLGFWNGLVGGKHTIREKPQVFSFKSQRAMRESFRQRRALICWEPGGSERLGPSTLSWSVLGTLQVAPRSRQFQREP